MQGDSPLGRGCQVWSHLKRDSLRGGGNFLLSIFKKQKDGKDFPVLTSLTSSSDLVLLEGPEAARGAPVPSRSCIWPLWFTWVGICLLESSWRHHPLLSHVNLGGWASSHTTGPKLSLASLVWKRSNMSSLISEKEMSIGWSLNVLGRLFKKRSLVTHSSFSEGSKVPQEHREEGR